MPSNRRFIPNPGAIASIDNPSERLVQSLSHIIDSVIPEDDVQTSSSRILEKCGSYGGLYQGPTSIAYLFLALSNYYPDLRIRSRHLIEWSKRFLEFAPTSFLESYKWTNAKCGIHNEMFVHAILTGIINRNPTVVDQLCSPSVVEELLKEGPEGQGGGVDEWLYGRAGFLYLLRMLKFWFVEAVDEKVTKPSTLALYNSIGNTAGKVIKRILLTPRPWTIWGTPYIGAVHGAIGIITQIVLTDSSYASILEVELEELLDLQLESGNWPSQFERDRSSPSSDKLVQFCHGAPGFVISLTELRKYYSNPFFLRKVDSCVARAQNCIWAKGLLTKDPNLCHGIAGNALAFPGEDAVNKTRFAHFVSFLKRENVQEGFKRSIYSASDSPLSLFCGEAGRAWLWAVADQGLEGKCLGYNDI